MCNNIIMLIHVERISINFVLNNYLIEFYAALTDYCSITNCDHTDVVFSFVAV